MGDERVGPGQDTSRQVPAGGAPSEEFSGPDVGFLFQTPTGVLAAQRLVGNEAVQMLLGPAASAEAAAALPIAVSRDGATAATPDSGGQAVAGNPGGSAEPLDGGPGVVTYSYSKSSTSGGNFQFTDPDYNSLMVTLTARMGNEEIGRCLPALALVLNGITIPQDGFHRQRPR